MEAGLCYTCSTSGGRPCYFLMVHSPFLKIFLCGTVVSQSVDSLLLWPRLLHFTPSLSCHCLQWWSR